jgi:hypothetical protein
MLTAESLSEEDWQLVLRACLFLVTVSGRFVLRTLADRLVADEDDIDDDDSDEEFHYPGSSTTPRPASVRSSTVDYFQRTPSRGPADLTPHLSQAPEFRVPTHEAPQKVLSPRWTPTPHSLHAQWERDEAVNTCRSCSRRFNFITRRVSVF